MKNWVKFGITGQLNASVVWNKKICHKCRHFTLS